MQNFLFSPEAILAFVRNDDNPINIEITNLVDRISTSDGVARTSVTTLTIQYLVEAIDLELLKETDVVRKRGLSIIRTNCQKYFTSMKEMDNLIAVGAEEENIVLEYCPTQFQKNENQEYTKDTKLCYKFMYAVAILNIRSTSTTIICSTNESEKFKSMVNGQKLELKVFGELDQIDFST